MLNTNCYKEGYDKGLNDALNGKSKNYSGVPKAKALISQNCVNTFMDGYNDGYRDGLAKKNNIYK